MNMVVIFFILYITSCFWIFPKIPFVKNSQLSSIHIWVLLALKMISGVVAAWYFKETFFAGDHNSINEIGKLQYNLLKTDPQRFFTEVTDDFNRYGAGSVFEASGSFWGYLRFTLLFKFTAVLDLISKGNFYFNSAIFSSLVFFGHIAFYRVFNVLYPLHKGKILAACFFIPSIWLYTACIHKDGFVFLSLGLVSFIFFKYLQPGYKTRLKDIAVLLISFLIIFLFRNYVLVALLPAMFTVLLCNLFPAKRKWVVAVSYGCYIVLFFLSGLLNNSFNLPGAVIHRKADFATLEQGSTNLPMNELKPDIVSFAGNIPQALNHTLLRPYLWESANISVLLAAIELFVYQCLFILAMLPVVKKKKQLHNFTLFGVLFFLTMILIIGLTIPNAGAIIRYRGIVWLFVICPLIANIDLKKNKAMVQPTGSI